MEKRKTHTSSTVKNRYNRKTYKQYLIQVRPDSDQDIVVRLEAQQNKSGYIKALIRADIQKEDKNINGTEIPGHLAYITGERADDALSYILEQENAMSRAGAGNSYYSEDYPENILRFYREARERYGVRIFDSLTGREYGQQ